MWRHPHLRDAWRGWYWGCGRLGISMINAGRILTQEWFERFEVEFFKKKLVIMVP